MWNNQSSSSSLLLLQVHVTNAIKVYIYSDIVLRQAEGTTWSVRFVMSEQIQLDYSGLFRLLSHFLLEFPFTWTNWSPKLLSYQERLISPYWPSKAYHSLAVEDHTVEWFRNPVCTSWGWKLEFHKLQGLIRPNGGCLGISEVELVLWGLSFFWSVPGA